MALTHKLNSEAKKDKKVEKPKPEEKREAAPRPSKEDQFTLVNQLAAKLNVKVTPDILGLMGIDSTSQLTDKLVEKALEHGSSDLEIEKAVKEMKF